MDLKNLSKKQQGILFALFMLVFISFMAGNKILIAAGLKEPKQQVVQATAQSKEDIAKAQALDDNDPSLKKLNILFIGNSYVRNNDLAQTLSDLARNDKDAKLRLNVQVIGDNSLGAEWNKGDAVNLIRSTKFDFVVLQEQNIWVLNDNNINNTRAAISSFSQEIKQSGAKAVLLQDWALQQGNQLYKDIKYATTLRNPQNMQQLIDTNTKFAGAESGATVIPIGAYWAYVTAKKPEINLYAADGNNPSLAGSYFTALLFYKYFSGGRKVNEINFIGKGIDKNTDATLKALISAN